MTDKLAVEYVPPESLRPAPYNPRTISPKSLRRLAELLDRHGFVVPVVARREDRLVIGGHQRLQANALRQRPAQEIPVLLLDGLSDAQAKALNVALNNDRAQGRFDAPRLATLLDEIAPHEPDLPAATGFSGAEIEELLSEFGGAASAAEELELPASYQVVVEVASEDQQRRVYERMTREGFRCRLLTL